MYNLADLLLVRRFIMQIFKFLLTLTIGLTMSIGYCQYPYPPQYQTHGFLSNYNPFDTRYYYPGFALPNDFEVLPDNQFNRNQYPGLLELQQRQLRELKKAEKNFPIYTVPIGFGPNS